jgi:thioredoxin 1
MANVPDVSESNFEAEVLQAAEPVLVDFWAPWCGPCRMIGPIVEQLAGENAGKLKVAKINVDENQNLAGSYGVSAIPTLILFHKGQIADRFVGVQPKSRLQGAIEQLPQ